MVGYITNTRVPMNDRNWHYAYSIWPSGSSPVSPIVYNGKPGEGFAFSSTNGSALTNFIDSVYTYRTSARPDNKSDMDEAITTLEVDNGLQTSTDVSTFPDTGHEFDLKRYSVNAKTVYDNFVGFDQLSNHYWHYSGPLGIFRASGSKVLPSQYRQGWNTSISDVDPSMGSRAIQAVSPTKPNSSLAADLIDTVRDGLPSVPGLLFSSIRRWSSLPKESASEFLNYVFGVNPTVQDLNQIWHSMINVRKIVNQMGRDSDRVVRRKYRFPTSIQTNSYLGLPTGGTMGSNYLSLSPQLSGGPVPFYYNGTDATYVNGHWFKTKGASTYSISTTVTTDTWFSGAFRYHLNIDKGLLGRLDRTGQLANKLVGSGVGLDTIWQVMPWSWFIDWFTDVGTLFQNGDYQLLYGQLLQYGYLMQHTVAKVAVTTDGHVTNSINGRDYGNLTTTFVSERKRRIRATPFGFGLNTSSFSAQQWAILGALGFTEAPRVLH